MMEQIITWLFIALGAVFIAVEDTIEYKYGASVFEYIKGPTRKWFSPSGWKLKYEDPWWVPVQLSDAIHVAKTLRYICFFVAFYYGEPLNIFENAFLNFGINGIIFGVVVSKSFMLFYGYLLRKPHNRLSILRIIFF